MRKSFTGLIFYFWTRFLTLSSFSCDINFFYIGSQIFLIQKKGRLDTGLFAFEDSSLLEIKHTLKHQPLHSQSCTVLCAVSNLGSDSFDNLMVIGCLVSDIKRGS